MRIKRNIYPAKGAFWTKVPALLVEEGFSDRQIALYVHLAAIQVGGQAKLVIREYARQRGTDERTIRRDLDALAGRSLIVNEGRAGRSVLIEVLDPDLVPVMERSTRSKVPHSNPWQLVEILCEKLGLLQRKGRITPHSAPHLPQGISLENLVLRLNFERSAPHSVSGRLDLEKYIDCATHREKGEPDGSPLGPDGPGRSRALEECGPIGPQMPSEDVGLPAAASALAELDKRLLDDPQASSTVPDEGETGSRWQGGRVFGRGQASNTRAVLSTTSDNKYYAASRHSDESGGSDGAGESLNNVDPEIAAMIERARAGSVYTSARASEVTAPKTPVPIFHDAADKPREEEGTR